MMDLDDIRESSPATLIEVFFWAILVGIALINLLNPDRLSFMGDIEPAPIIDVPGYVAILLLFGSPLWIYITKFTTWLQSRLSNLMPEILLPIPPRG